MSEWISVDERFPEVGQKVDVLFASGYRGVDFCYGRDNFGDLPGLMFLDDEGFAYLYSGQGAIIHWMPVPKPPMNTPS